MSPVDVLHALRRGRIAGVARTGRTGKRDGKRLQGSRRIDSA
ncbi:hypothetical protein VSR69_01045 [Paraburkholderia phytofirmans]|jgi:hypothetical protein|nr:hypothetical protein [Paraburkholderia sp. BL9I2N2]